MFIIDKATAWTWKDQYEADLFNVTSKLVTESMEELRAMYKRMFGLLLTWKVEDLDTEGMFKIFIVWKRGSGVIEVRMV